MFVEESTRECFFNIPELLKNSDYKITKEDGYNTIEGYTCSYAFSKEQHDKNKEELPENMVALLQQKNKLDYYLIVSFEDMDNEQIISECDKILELHTIPSKISIICKTKSVKSLIRYFKNQEIYQGIDWKLHNMSQTETDVVKLQDILNVNIIKKVNNILYVHSKSLHELNEDLNYINFLSKVLKPKYAAIRKNDENLDGLFISAANLKILKNEHEAKYVDFLQENSTLVRKYYE